MDGLLLKLTGAPAFWKLFKPIRRNLDGLAWCFLNPPWTAAPPGFEDDASATMHFEGDGETGLQLWAPGSLSRYADRFDEESIEMWGVDPARHDPPRVATSYIAAPWSEADDLIRRHASFWLKYTDAACWEIYASDRAFLDLLAMQLRGKPEVEAFPSRDDAREEAFRAAGLGGVWEGLGR